jgi:hypothetical protein
MLIRMVEYDKVISTSQIFECSPENPNTILVSDIPIHKGIDSDEIRESTAIQRLKQMASPAPDVEDSVMKANTGSPHPLEHWGYAVSPLQDSSKQSGLPEDVGRPDTLEVAPQRAAARHVGEGVVPVRVVPGEI